MNEIANKSMRTGITIENRERVLLNGIVSVERFDDREIFARCEHCSVSVYGQNLRINRLDLDNGVLVINGFISGCEYADKKEREGLFTKIFK